MSTRGSKLSRAVQYFRESDVDEMRVAFILVKEIVESRLGDSRTPAPVKVKRHRKPKGTAMAGTSTTVEQASAAASA